MIPTAIHYITVNWIPDTDVILQKAHNTPSADAGGVLCERENERVYGNHLSLKRQMGVSGLPERASHCPDETAVVGRPKVVLCSGFCWSP